MEVDISRSTSMGASIGSFHGSKLTVGSLDFDGGWWKLPWKKFPEAYTTSMEVNKISMYVMFFRWEFVKAPRFPELDMDYCSIRILHSTVQTSHR